MPQPPNPKRTAQTARNKIVQSGSGAIATGGSAAGGAGSTVVHAPGANVVILPPAPTARARAKRPPSAAVLLRAFAAPLRTVADHCSRLVTRGLNLDRKVAEKLRLAHVYVSLETKTPQAAAKRKPHLRTAEMGLAKFAQAESVPLPALDALFDPAVNRVVLVGEPGSGKSTLLQYVTLCLADRLGAARGERSRLAGVKVPAVIRQRRIVPFQISLRDFAGSLAEGAAGTSQDVEGFLQRRLDDQNHAEAGRLLPALLERGLAFVQFDGLDEVPKARVPAVRAAIVAFAGGAYSRCRIVVTCRAKSYAKPEFRLEGFPPEHEIAPLTKRGRAEFVHAWYRELEIAQPEFGGEGEGCATDLLGAIASERLREMAGNPFFLTAMAALHRPESPLPDTSAELMSQLVDSVLEESRKRGQSSETTNRESELAALLKPVPEGVKQLRRRLAAIAFATRADRRDRNSRWVNDDLLRARLVLAKNLPASWVDDLLEALLHRAGLLQSPDGSHFEFAYRFEEFLAGCHLANDDAWSGDDGPFVVRARRLFREQGDYARQVLVWAAGFNAHVQSGAKGRVRELVRALTPDAAVGSADGLAALELAGDIARDAGMEAWLDEDVPDTAATVGRLRARLEEVRDGEEKFATAVRARAASAIGRLGDRRRGVGLREDGAPDIDWIALPVGLFPMGDNEDYCGGRRWPCPLITEPYAISRYPVTVEQYRAFVTAGGYRDDGGKADEARLRRWWTEAGLRWKRAAGICDPLEPSNVVFQTSNHPRVGVSWFEAAAFCGWLTEELRRVGALSAGQTVLLPSEAQWERAARHTDGRQYPWKGHGAPKLHCNMYGTEIGHTSAVGLFPKGNAECGAADIVGNVLEWCRTEWRDDYKDYEKKVSDRLEGEGARVLRGGAFNLVTTYVRCAYRLRLLPGGRSDRIGFRVAASPFSDL